MSRLWIVGVRLPSPLPGFFQNLCPPELLLNSSSASHSLLRDLTPNRPYCWVVIEKAASGAKQGSHPLSPTKLV